jgi:acyl-CoA dehydrogenase
MDFSLSDEQMAVRDLAAQIFEGKATVARVKEIEATPERVDRELWRELARANLLGIALPEDVGGSGLGMVELCLVLEQQGRRVAPVPLWPALVLGALPLAEFGSPEQRRTWLPEVVAGDVMLTAALDEGGAADARRPQVKASAEGRLTGTKLSVPAAHVAARILVPATDADGGVSVYLVDPAGPGATLEQAETTSRQIHSHLTLDAAAAEVLGPGGQGSRIVSWMLDRAMVGLAAMQVGICEEAVRMAAEYTSNRRQFGRPLSSFQGTALKAADAYIDTEAIRVTMVEAAWRLAEGLDAGREAQVAKWWAAEAGQRVVHTTQHLHGGMGADVDYPVHRYFLWGKQIETMLGGASATLATLGQQLAATSP